MANIQKRGDTYRIRVLAGRTPDGKEIMRSMTYKPKSKSASAIKREVEKQAVLFENKVHSGAIIPKKVSFAKFYREEWLRHEEMKSADDEKRLSERTRQDYCFNIERYAFPAFGTIEIGKINRVTCQNFIDDLKKNLSSNSVRKIVASVNSVFRYAARMGAIQEDPFLYCELPALKKRTPEDLHYFTVEQARRFLKAIREPYSTTYFRDGKSYAEEHEMQLQLQCFFTLAIYGGFRRGELLSLTWNDIDLQNGKIAIKKATSAIRDGYKENGAVNWKQIEKDPKTDAGKRQVEVPKQCLELLKRWKSEEKRLAIMLGDNWQGCDKWHFADNFVFIRLNNGRQMNVKTPYLAFKRFIKRYNSSVDDSRLKLPDIRLHDLRHTTATLLIAEGVDIETVAKRLGHAKASTTIDIYGHATPDKDEEASNILGSLLG